MQVLPFKTDRIKSQDRDLLTVLDRFLPALAERSIVAVTSKIVAICDGRVVRVGSMAKSMLIAQEAEYFLPPSESQYGYTLTIRHNLLVPSAGIDESNADGYYVLWPEDPQRAANAIRQHLTERFSLSEMGVIITDSTTRPLRWGSLAWRLPIVGSRR